MPDTTRRLLSIATIVERLDCSPASVRRRSLNPHEGFPQLRNIGRLFAFEDELLQWMEARPLETEKPTKYQTKRNGTDREGDTE
jgi:hypothetical protein